MSATACRLRALFRPLISLPSSQPQNPHRLLHRFFSSSSNHHSCRNPPLYSDDQKERDIGSNVYRRILKTQRPATIRWQKGLENCVSFIGRVYYPIKTFTRIDGVQCAYTHLKLDSEKFIKILINMWEDMAELSIQHLKPNDLIYVSGYLRSFKKTYDNGSIILSQKVTVNEINYVAYNNQKTKNIEDERESALERERKRLYLWQVFFANPYEWRDLRKCKVNPRQPDFKHKSTGESLWLNSHDPPWVMRQLQLQDSRMGDMGLFTSRPTRSTFNYNDI